MPRVSPGYRISFTQSDIATLADILSRHVNESYTIVMLHKRLNLVLFQIDQGLKIPTNTSSRASAHSLGFDDIPESPPLEASTFIQVPIAINIPQEILKQGPLIVERYKAFKKWERDARTCSKRELEMCEEYRAANGLLSEEETIAFNNKWSS